MCRFLCGHKFANPLSKHQGAQFLEHMVRVCLVLLRSLQSVFQSGCTMLCSHHQWVRVPVAPHFGQHLVLSGFWILAIWIGCLFFFSDLSVLHLISVTHCHSFILDNVITNNHNSSIISVSRSLLSDPCPVILSPPRLPHLGLLVYYRLLSMFCLYPGEVLRERGAWVDMDLWL